MGQLAKYAATASGLEFITRVGHPCRGPTLHHYRFLSVGCVLSFRRRSAIFLLGLFDRFIHDERIHNPFEMLEGPGRMSRRIGPDGLVLHQLCQESRLHGASPLRFTLVVSNRCGNGDNGV